jgi:hypothetical protein
LVDGPLAAGRRPILVDSHFLQEAGSHGNGKMKKSRLVPGQGAADCGSRPEWEAF